MKFAAAVRARTDPETEDDSDKYAGPAIELHIDMAEEGQTAVLTWRAKRKEEHGER